MRFVSPLGMFLAVSIVGVTLTVMSLLYLHVRLTEGYVDTYLDSHNESIAIVLRNSLMRGSLEQDLLADRERLSESTLVDVEAILERELSSTPVIKVKVYNRNGIVIYSSKTDEIGEDASDNRGFRSALAGTPISSKVDPDHINEFDRVVEIQNLHQQYIPIVTTATEEPIGVFETYLDIIGIINSVEAMQRAMLWLVGGVLGLIYLALALTFLRTFRELGEQTRLRDVHLQALMEMRANLEQRVAERTAQLNAAKDHLQATMDNVPDAILTCDSDFVIESANHAALTLFRLSESELTGRKLSEFFAGEQSNAMTEEEFCDHHQAELRRDGGEGILVDLWKGALDDGEGPRRYIVVVRDITSQIRAQRDLEMTRKQYFHQEKMAAIGQLAAGILHEVGNPIAAIAGAAADTKLSLGGAAADDSIGQNIELIDQQITRLGKITRDIAEFASPRPRAREMLDLNGLLQSTANLLTYDRRFGSMGVHLELDRNLPAVVGVADQLTQVFMNLLINSMDACSPADPNEDCIFVTSDFDGDRVHVCVEDHGSGMSAEVLEHVTESFYTTKTVGEGTGLGLSLCETIIDDHGGELRIESEEGKGTRVHVYLPLDLPEAVEAQSEPSGQRHSG